MEQILNFTILALACFQINAVLEVTGLEQKVAINQCLECSPEGKEWSRCEVWVIILFL